MEALVNKSFRMIFTEKREIIDIKGIKTLIDQIIGEIEGLNVSQREQVKVALEQMIGEEALKSSLQKSLIEYPNEEITIGKEWKIDQSTKTPYPMNVKTTYLVTSIDQQYVNLRIDSVIRSDSEKMNFGGMEMAIDLNPVYG